MSASSLAAGSPPPAAVRAAARRPGVWLAAIVALALLVRILVVVATPGFVPREDAHDYDRIAVSLVDTHSFPPSYLAPHGGPSAFRPPLFPVALAGVYELTGTSDARARWTAGRILEAVLGALTVALVALIARRVWGWRVALVAGGLAAVYPPLVLIGSSLMTESLFIPLVLAAVLCALHARGREGQDAGAPGRPARLGWAAAAGVLLAAAGLTRSNGIIVALALVFMVWSGRPRWAWRSLRTPLALLVALGLALVPWTLRNEHVFHQFVPTTTQLGYGLAGTYNPLSQGSSRFPAIWIPPTGDMAPIYRAHPTANEAQVSSQLTHEALRYIEHHPASLPRTLWWTGLRLLNASPGFERWDAPYEAFPTWLAAISVYAFWALGLLGILGLVQARALARRAPASLWWCPVLLIASTVLLDGSTRYRSPADPFLLMLAALALTALWERSRRSRAAVTVGRR